MSSEKNNARMIDLNTIISAGIDPKTKLPIRCGASNSRISKEDIKKILRIIDEQDAVNKGTWYNLPDGLNSRLMERIIYYRGQAMFFQLDGRFFFLPYALDGEIDVYGRFTMVTPLPFNGTAKAGEDADKPWIRGLRFKPVYDIQLPEDFIDKSDGEIEEFLSHSCVLLKDYTEQISQTNISRQILNDSIIDFEAECLPFMRTALLNSTGITGVRVGDADEESNVKAASILLNDLALRGEKFMAIVGNLDFQELTPGQIGKAEEFLMAMQSLDNFRLSTHGLTSGGIFQKQAHVLEAEQAMNEGNTGLVMRDGVQIRQDFCHIVNSIWGIGMWYEPSEVVTMVDRNGDGILGSNEDEGTNQGGAQGGIEDDTQ